jgi:hypothetical protein
MTYEEELQSLRDAGWEEFSPGAHTSASTCFAKRFPGPRCWGNSDKPLSIFISVYDHRPYGHKWGYQMDINAQPTEGEAWIKFESYAFGGIEHIDEQAEMLLTAWKAIATHKGEENG